MYVIIAAFAVLVLVPIYVFGPAWYVSDAVQYFRSVEVAEGEAEYCPVVLAEILESIDRWERQHQGAEYPGDVPIFSFLEPDFELREPHLRAYAVLKGTFEEHLPELQKPETWRSVRGGSLRFWRRAAHQDADFSSYVFVRGGDVPLNSRLRSVHNALSNLSSFALHTRDHEWIRELGRVYSAMLAVRESAETLVDNLFACGQRGVAIYFWEILSAHADSLQRVRAPIQGQVRAAEALRSSITLERGIATATLGAERDWTGFGYERWTMALSIVAAVPEDRSFPEFMESLDGMSAGEIADTIGTRGQDEKSWFPYWAMIGPAVGLCAEAFEDLRRQEARLIAVCETRQSPDRQPPEPYRTAVLADGSRVLFDPATSPEPDPGLRFEELDVEMEGGEYSLVSIEAPPRAEGADD